MEWEQLDGKSWVVGNLPIGCQLCAKGAKAVFFMGGDCLHPDHCRWYCPISLERKDPNAYFIDEIPIQDLDQDKIFETLCYEIDKIKAEGISITGGDPLSSSLKRELVVKLVSALKVKYGKEFHVHLYTSGKNFSSQIAEDLDLSGLDAVRFHPGEEDFANIEFAIGHSYQVAAEVPIIPTQEYLEYLMRLGDYLENIGADYMNLNEFEMTVSNQKELLNKGFHIRKDSGFAIENSAEFAEKFVAEFKPKHLTIHYCSVQFKDNFQLRQRYKRRAETIKEPYEEITDDGTLQSLEIQGSAKEVQNLERYLLNIAKIPSKLIKAQYSAGKLWLPPFLAYDQDFIDLLEDFKVKAGIIEIFPFREPKNFQLVEYTPVFPEEESK